MRPVTIHNVCSYVVEHDIDTLCGRKNKCESSSDNNGKILPTGVWQDVKPLSL